MRQKIVFLVLSTVLLFNYCSFFDKDLKTEPEKPARQEEEQVTGERIELEKVEPPAKPPTETITEKEAAAVRKTIETAPKGKSFQTGIASWYGGDFHGNRTANGEIYDMYKLTAAHKTLAFNTLVEVENMDNSKRVIVRINDRGPFLKDRIIDLSYKAAQKLGCDADGVAPVVLRIVKPGTITPGGMDSAGKMEKETVTETETRSETVEPPVSPPPEDTPVEDTPPDNTAYTRYFLQAGAFSERANAEKMLRNIKYILPDIPFNIQLVDGLYKVLSGPLHSRPRADELKKILLDIDIDAFIKEL